MFSLHGWDVEFSSSIPMAVVLGCGAAGIAVMTGAFYGWGRLTRRLTGLPSGTWPVSATLGLASVVFLGGVLNLCRLAHPPALAGIVIVGLALAALAKRQDGNRRPKVRDARVSWYAVSWGAAVVTLTGFALATQLAPSLYNAVDDFQHYFPHAVRMVETGTLYGSPLNALGGITLGGQAFLQAFIVAYFPLRFINGADAVFCFFLCLVLAGAVAIGRPALGLAGLVGTLAVFIIDPQYVNIASLYSSAAMISALVILSIDSREGSDANSLRWRQAAAPALFYAGTIALKPTGVVFLGLQFGIAAAASYWSMRDWRASLANAWWIAFWSVVFISPWLLLYAPYYLIGLVHPLGPPSTPVPQMRVLPGTAALFSPEETFYGPSRLAYTCLVAGVLVCTLYAVMKARVGLTSRRSLVGLASASSAVGASYVFWVLIGPHLDESASVFRYSIPALIGAASAALPLCILVSARGGAIIPVIAAALVALLFASSTRERVTRLLDHGTALAYLHRWSTSQIDRARKYVEPVLHGDGIAEVRRIQQMIPPGEALFAWTTVPFLLDYRRNEIIDVNEEGLGKPWGRISKFGYVLWQHDGYGVKSKKNFLRHITIGGHTGTLNARELDVVSWLDGIGPMSKILSDQHGVMLFRTKEGAPPPPN